MLSISDFERQEVMKKKQVLKRMAAFLLAAAFIFFGGYAIYKAAPDTAAGGTREDEQVQEVTKQREDAGGENKKTQDADGREPSPQKGGLKKQDAATKNAAENTNSAKPQEPQERREGKVQTPEKPKQPQNSNAGTKPENKPIHTHSWEAVYGQVQIPVYGDKCNYCGYGTNAAGGIYAHIDADPFDHCGSYSTGAVIGYSTATEIIGYKCPCGATK